jgi:hypothetical protein
MRIIILLVCFSITFVANAQSSLSSYFINNHLIDRYEIQSGKLSDDIFTTVKPYRRDALASFSQDLVLHSKVDSFNQQYLLNDNLLFADNTSHRKSLFKYFYKNESALYHINQKDFKVIVNPILAFTGGTNSADSLNHYRNTRGVEVRGQIGGKVGFYTYALENQARYTITQRAEIARTRVVNGTTLHKRFGTAGSDFFNVAGYVTFSPIKEIMVQAGQDRNFIGNGYRSLILADRATTNPFVKINTKVWKINYMNLFSEHTDFIRQSESVNNPKKFSAFHHFSLNLTENLNIGLFENIIFDRQDSTETGRYELSYLNPLIFYRAVEHGLNSRDNAVLGADIKWNFLNRFSLYGQLVLDEFTKDKMFGRTKDWANKWAYQLGLKYINVAGINNLDAQFEINQVRPYVYQHRYKSQNWIHYNQSLAHPLGANFRELVGVLRYQPLNRLQLEALAIYNKQGTDSSETGLTYGGNAIRAYENIPNRSFAPMFQGVLQTNTVLQFTATYMLWHNLFMDARYTYHQRTNELKQDNTNHLFTIGLRMNALPYRWFE